ncbi:hypothetical protein, partial [Halomonas garicola]
CDPCFPLPEGIGKSGSNLAQGFKRSQKIQKSRFPNSDESLALIAGDLSPTQASAHMNYLINLLKSVSLTPLAGDDLPRRLRGRRILHALKRLSTAECFL